MSALFAAAKRLYWRCRMRALAAEQKTIDRALRELDIDLRGLRLRRNELSLDLSRAKAEYRLLAKPFEIPLK